MDIATLVKHLKGASSKWINNERKVPEGFEWSRGYGAFSVDPRNVDLIITYIKNQKQHHMDSTTDDRYEIT